MVQALADVFTTVVSAALLVAGGLALLAALFWLSSRAWSYLRRRYLLWTAARSRAHRNAETLLAALSLEVGALRDAEAMARARGDVLLKIARDQGVLCAVPDCEQKAVLFISRTRPATPSRFCGGHTSSDLAHRARRESTAAKSGGRP
ncbi:MAG TPA: hypothetical protein VH083_11340 [Myxococcales bacterium]|jgi:hypothetical protein|nr:hypothetical protein [Myxococcales bacterium]